MKQILEMLKRGFESSSMKTPEWKSFSRIFKNKLVIEFAKFGGTITEYHVGHFYVSGFFRTPDNSCYYFSISDVRFFNDNKLMWRTAAHEKDFTGGRNRYVSIAEGMGEAIGDQIYMDKHKISFLLLEKSEGTIAKWPGSIGG